MKSIVVTGAGSGIGRCVAERLAAQGHHVLACARQPADLETLGAVAGIEPAALDVGRPEQVDGQQRLELAPHGVQVSIVQPGAVATGIGERGAVGMRARLLRAKPPFEAEAQAVLAGMDAARDAPAKGFNDSEPELAGNRRSSPPEVVAEAVEHALFSPTPRARYLVGSRWEGQRVVDNLITRLLDANEGPSMGYTRDELLALVDAALAQRAAAQA